MYKGNGTIKQNTPSPLTSTRVRAVKMMWVEETDEQTKDNKKTYTIFYIAEVVKNETNKYGSALHKIQEGSGFKTYSTYRNVSPGPTALYAKDNKDGSREAYTITGTWSPQIGDTPENDGE